MLVLVGTVKISDRLVREMLGLQKNKKKNGGQIKESMKYLVTSYKDNKEKQEIESKGLYCYDLRHSDDGGKIATIEKSVLVNRIGSIITDKELKFGNKIYNSFIDFEEFSARNTEVYTIEQLQYKQKEKANENSSKVITGERESTIKQLAKENKCNVRDIEVLSLIHI